MPLELRDDPRPGGIVLPSYDGRSILNVPATVCAALGVPRPTDAPPLDPSIVPPAMLDGVSAVVLLVVDGLGRNVVESGVGQGGTDGATDLDGERPAFGGWLAAARGMGRAISLGWITSIFPSSTMPAIASLNTGLAPAEHGLLGWTVYLDEFGEATELARWGPARASGSFQDAELGGHDPRAFFGRRTLYRHLRAHDVRATAVVPVAYRGSGYTEMVFGGARFSEYFAPSSIPMLVDHALGGDGRRFVYAYWPTVDLVEHHALRHDPAGGDIQAEIDTLDDTLRRWLERRRPTRASGDTLLLLTADHGHVFGSPGQVVRFSEHPALLDRLICAPTGERRVAYLHARPGQSEAVRTYCEAHFAEAARVLDPSELLAQGLFGPGGPSDAARRRAGDVVLLARGDWQLIASHRPRHDGEFLYGNHGGLDPREMLVPLIAVRL